MLNKLFSINYDAKYHKIFSLFGIKFKIKLSNKEYIKRQKLKGNSFILYKKNGDIVEFPQIKGLQVIFDCTNSCVEIYEPYDFLPRHSNNSTCIRLDGKNNKVLIKGTKYYIEGLGINIFGQNNNLTIGKNFLLNGKSDMVIGDDEGISITIGDDCLFAGGLLIYGTDWHTVYEIRNPKNVYNKTKFGISIGNHVWICSQVSILNDVIIPNNTIVALGSVVTKAFEEENTILGGVPAKVLKENVNWDIRSTQAYFREIDTDTLKNI